MAVVVALAWLGLGGCFPALPPAEDTTSDIAGDVSIPNDTATDDTVISDTAVSDTATTDTATTDTATTDTATTDTATSDTATTETSSNPCDGVDCGHGGTCSVNASNNPQCNCPNDFVPVALRCVASNSLAIANLPATVTFGLEKSGTFTPTLTRPEGIAAPVWSLESGHDCSFAVTIDNVSGVVSWLCDKSPSTCEVTVSVTASGLSGAGELGIACVNTPPVVTNVRVVPDFITTIGQELACAWDFEDPDLQPDQSRIVWLVNGVEVAEGPFFSNYSGNAKVACAVYPNDGFGEGDPVLSIDVYAPADMRYILSLGAYDTCALRDGKVACWGRYGWGGGTGTSSATATVVPAWASGVTAVAVGTSHVCAIRQGALYCMGNNASGQLGVTSQFGTGTFVHTPVAVSSLASGVTRVAAGSSHTCAIQNGALYCFGRNADGELGVSGNTNTATPTAVPGFEADVTDIAISGSFGTTTCAIRAGGLYCWGNFTAGQVTNMPGWRGAAAPVPPTVVPGFETGVTGVAIGNEHVCVETVSATFCWGSNYYGQCADPAVETTTAVGFTPVANTTTTVTQVAAGGRHTCAVFSGVLHCWGWNVYGQLGLGWVAEDQSARNVGIPVPGAVFGFETLAVTSVAAGYEHACAATRDGVWCWGKNQYGELGRAANVGTFDAHPVPVQLVLPN